MQSNSLSLERQVQDVNFNLKDQFEYDQFLLKTALDISRSLNIDELLKTTVAEVKQLLETDRVIIYRFESDWNGTVVAEAVAEQYSSMLGSKLEDPFFAQNLIQSGASIGSQVTGHFTEGFISQSYIDFLIQFQIRSNLVIPILYANGSPIGAEQGGDSSKKLWGLLATQQCSVNRSWDATEIEVLQKLAIYLEPAIQRTELYNAAATGVIACRKADAEVKRLNTELEERIHDRTVQLQLANQKLKQEIKEHKSIERNLFAEKELAQITLEAIGDAVITTDAQGRIQYFNPVAEHLTGWKIDEVKGLLLTDVFHIVNEITRRTVENPLCKVLRSGQIASLAHNTILISRDGTEYPIEDSAAPIRASNGEVMGVVLVFHDVTQSRYLARQLSWQANHDDLTGLFNRRTFERQLTDAIVGARSQNQHHVLCFLDLDQFKAVNDTCGHAAGDELLCQITALLQERVRVTDTLARLGGDEFGLLLHQCSLPQAEQVADTLRQMIQEFNFVWQGKTFSIGVSIGLVAIDAESQNLNTVLSAADAACYAAKERGRNCIYVYQRDDLKLEQHRSERQWIARIDQALKEDRFCLYCQKIAPMNETTGVDHYEVLLRLIDETGELVPPMAFIPAAERYHLIPAIDQWVIRTFFTRYEEHFHGKTGHGNGLYTINLSGGSVNSDEFLDFLKGQFAEHDIAPQNICFEITETTAIANLDQAAQLIRSLKTLGCSFALDDFGTGMSSLAYLKTLPVDYLKIDGGFIKDIDSDQMDYAMVECFNRLSHFMGIQTIAECVESESALKKLRTIGVDYAQGFCIDKPSPLCFV